MTAPADVAEDATEVPTPAIMPGAESRPAADDAEQLGAGGLRALRNCRDDLRRTRRELSDAKREAETLRRHLRAVVAVAALVEEERA